MKRILLGLFVFALIAVALLLGGNLSGRAALSVTSDPSGEKVYLDNAEVGLTPFQSDQLNGGEVVLNFGNFNQKVRLNAGTLTVVNWALGPTDTFSAGEVVWLSSASSSELLVIAKPAAEVFLDGKSLGESPLSKPVDPGEYTLELKKDGYLTRSVKLSLRGGFRTNLSTTLSLNPFPAEVKTLSSPNPNLIVSDLSSKNPLLLAEPAAWAKGAAFWDSRVAGGTDYNFLLTLEGKLYDLKGSEVSLDSLGKTSEKTTLGYLGDGSAPLTTAAQQTLDAFAAKLYPPVPQVEILEPGTGFLRVRSGPGVSYAEIGRATPGQRYPYLGEEGGWFKITFDGREGWVSGDFARKL